MHHMDDTGRTDLEIWLKRARYLGSWTIMLRDFIDVLSYGWGKTLLVTDGGATGRQIFDLLQEAGIRAWGPSFQGHALKLRVQPTKADQAAGLLTEAGITVDII